MDYTAFNYVQPTGDIFIDIIQFINLWLFRLPTTSMDSDGEYNLFTGMPSVDVNTDDGSCIDRVYGCLDNDYIEYNVVANSDDGS